VDAAVAPRERITVMLADDHSVYRLGLRELLQEDREIEIVAEAESGDEAVQRALDSCPDVVVMDLRMPNKNGIQATREIKSALPKTEVVVLSAFDDEEEVLQALEAGARAYLLKDDDPTSTLRAVHAASVGRLYLGPSLAKRVLQRMAAAPPAVQASLTRRSDAREHLTAREISILQLVAQGCKGREVASRLGITESTVRNHLRNIFTKLRVSDRRQAILYAVKNGLVSL